MENTNRHYWLHKENYEGDVAMSLLEKGYLCYGWLFVAQKLNDYDSWKAIEEIIREEFGYYPRKIDSVWIGS